MKKNLLQSCLYNDLCPITEEDVIMMWNRKTSEIGFYKGGNITFGKLDPTIDYHNFGKIAVSTERSKE